MPHFADQPKLNPDPGGDPTLVPAICFAGSIRSNDAFLNTEAELSEWLLALQQAIRSEQLESPNHELLPTAVLDELDSLTRLDAPEAAEDRASLQSDLADSLDAVGARLGAESATALDDFRRDTLSRLPEMLRTREGIQVAAAAGSVLRSRLTSSEGVRAAWRDLVEAFQDEGPYEDSLHLLEIMRGLIEARGHAWETESERIARILNGSAAHARDAGADIPPPPPPEDGRTRWLSEPPADLSEAERVALIEKDLGRAANEEELDVWLLIEDAVIGDGIIERGAVTFFDVRRLHGRAIHNPPDYRGLGLPDGREREIAGLLLEAIEDPTDTQAVLVRVKASGTRGNTASEARRTVESLLDLATQGEERPGWELASGHFVTTTDGAFWTQFGSRTTMSSYFRRFHLRPEKRLAELDSNLIEAWEAGHSGALEAVDLARWERALSLATDESFRVALGIRNLERVLPKIRGEGSGRGRGSTWTQVVTYYLKDEWCWAALRGHLELVCFHTVSAPMRPMSVGPEIREPDTTIADFYQAIRELVGEEKVTSAQLIENARTIGDLVPAGSSRRRILEGIARLTADPEMSQNWLTELGQRFDVLLARSARQRNAAVHGGATVPSVLDTVSPFVADLGQRVVSGAMRAAATDDSLAVWFERTRLHAREESAMLREGRPLSEMV